jgi:hypothetical protein
VSKREDLPLQPFSQKQYFAPEFLPYLRKIISRKGFKVKNQYAF